MIVKNSLVRRGTIAVKSLCCLSAVLLTCEAQAGDSFINGFDGGGNAAPTVNHPFVIGDFDDGTTQGWSGVRMPTVSSIGGVLTNTNTAGLRSDGNGDSWVWLNTGSNPLFTVGELPGQFDILQFDVRIDTLPPSPLDSRIRGRNFFQGGVTHGITYQDNGSFPAAGDWTTYTVVRESTDSSWGDAVNRVRLDIIDGIGNTEPAPVLGAQFSVDNVILGRTSATAAFPVIAPNQPNIILNGDLSATSNVSLTGSNTGAFNINGGNGNFGPFRGNTGDVDHWTPYNNNPDSIVEAVADGGALDLLHSSNGNQGSFYLDTHWAVGAEQFTLNSAGGYLNGLTQTDILNGVTIDENATYELAFDLNFNDLRLANADSNFKVGLTVGTNSTDPNSAVAGSLFDDQLTNILAGDRQTLSISGAALKAAQDSGDPVNLIVQSLAASTINNFPGGTPVANDHVDGDVFTQVQVDNLSLIRTFTILTGDVNKDGLLTQADVNLAQLYLDGDGGETAAVRQSDLSNLGTAPSASDVLTSLNLVDFDLSGDDVFDAADVALLMGLVPASALGDFNDDGNVDLADLDRYNGNIGAAAAGALLALDLDGDGTVGADDFAQHYETLVETSNGQVGTFGGDVNLDGVVDVLGDAAAIIDNLGNSVTSWSQGDVNGDGTVDVLGDAALLVDNLGNSNAGAATAATAAVPEPSSLSLLALAGLGAISRRRR